MIGLDTGILLRLFECGKTPYAAAAENLIAHAGSEGACFVHPLVLAEIAWTLERTFKLERSTVADYLELILRAPEFTFSGAEEAIRAVERFREGLAHFSDCFLAELNLAAGCETTVTFDVCAAESAGFTLLAS